MILYLVRHAIAEEATRGQADEERALSPEGVSKFQNGAKGIVRLAEETGLGVIWTSPLLRARQTAGILAAAVSEAKWKTEVKVSANLGPPGNLARFLKEAREGHAEAMAAVGHEPILSEWAGRICFGNAGRLEMKKGAVVVIEMDDVGTRGELRMLVQPGVLRRVAGRGG